MRWPLLMLAACGSSVSPTTEAPDGPRVVTLVHQARGDGEVEPCG